MTICAIYRSPPSWGPPEGRAHHTITIDGVDYWAETDGPPPDETEARHVLFGAPPGEAEYGAAVQAHIEATVRARNYHDAATCASYIGSTIPAWQADAETFVAWRDSVWVYVYAQLAAVQAEQRTQPSIEDLVYELPAIDWPA